jgi:hypothetical protein
MADNVAITAGTGTTVASDDIGGVQHQRVKLSLGADGTANDAVAGAGAVGTGVQRVTLASDDPAVTSLQIMDDWDESDRAKVNIIAGQAGVSAGNGASGAAVPRVTIANDSTGVLASIGAISTSVTPGNGAANLGKAEDAAHASGDTGVLMLAVRRDVAASGTSADGDYATLNVDSNGALRVTGAAGTTQYTEDGASAGGESLCLMGAVRRDTAASSSGTDGDYSTLNVDANGRLHVNVGAGSIAGIVDDAAFTPATSEVLPVGFFADEASTDSVNEGDIGAARITLDRKLIVTPYAHAAAGGWSSFKSLDLDESEEEIKASAGKLGWLHVINLAATKRYLKIYNATAANVTVGTTTPVLTFPIPTMADTNGAGFWVNFGDVGQQFDTAICAAATTGLADNDTGAPGANEVVFNCGYL